VKILVDNPKYRIDGKKGQGFLTLPKRDIAGSVADDIYRFDFVTHMDVGPASVQVQIVKIGSIGVWFYPNPSFNFTLHVFNSGVEERVQRNHFVVATLKPKDIKLRNHG
jgi:hypothetical protein